MISFFLLVWAHSPDNIIKTYVLVSLKSDYNSQIYPNSHLDIVRLKILTYVIIITFIIRISSIFENFKDVLGGLIVLGLIYFLVYSLLANFLGLIIMC